LLLLELQRPLGVPAQEDRRPLALVCDEAQQLEAYAVTAIAAELTPRALRYAEHLDPQLAALSVEFWRDLARHARSGADVALAPNLLRAYRPDLTLLEQGADLTRDALVAQFRGYYGRGQGLLGTRSFWEGISLEGEQLSLVVSDRLPFTPPSPVQRAKQAALAAHGGNWFMHLALPEALAALRQGVGRLIRTTTERGGVALFDPRLTSKAWGRQVLNALPRFRVTRQRNAVAGFLRTGGRP